MSAEVLPSRADLLALDADALAALTNRGLVKRAEREVDRDPPRVLPGVDTAVIAEFSDGVRSELPAGGLEQGTCSCGAITVCRHLLGLVFAYRRIHEREPAAGESDWSPGQFSDADLTARIGARLVESARRTARAGYTARIRRGDIPVAELPSATVRFLVPHDLGYVHTDARAGVRDDVIALAVWAFRAADAQDPGTADCVVDVGGTPKSEAATGTGLEPVVEFAADVLRAGVVHAGDGLAAAAAAHLSRLEQAGLRWPLDATAELADQLAGYRQRSARYSPARAADLIAELFARHRALAAGGAGVRSRVLGSEEAAQTPLRRVRLDGLGARVTAVDDERRVEIFHAQAATGVVLVSHREWTTADDGPALSRRRFGGATVGALAGGVLITESAVRSASRTVRLPAGRIARSTVTVASGAWDVLPPSLLVTDYARAAEALDALPPRPVRARVRAELVRVLAVAEVGGVHYSPGEQRLTVRIRDSSGTAAFVTATHAAVAPGRLDAVAGAFSGRHGTPRYVAGSVHRGGGGLVVDPYAIAADGPLIVPDLAAVDPGLVPGPVGAGAAPGTAGPGPAAGSAGPSLRPGSDADPLGGAVAEARGVLADMAHAGLAHLPASSADRLRGARDAVACVGLRRVAAALDELAARLGPDPGSAATQAWVDAYLRVGLAAESL